MIEGYRVDLSKHLDPGAPAEPIIETQPSFASRTTDGLRRFGGKVLDVAGGAAAFVGEVAEDVIDAITDNIDW